MAGYSRHWNCRICKQPQETVDAPNAVVVCENCLSPLAEKLCKEALGNGVGIKTAGVDETYWRSKAREYANYLFIDWRPAP